MKNIITLCSDELEADGEIWRALLNSCNPLRVRKTETNHTKKRKPFCHAVSPIRA